MPHTLYYTAVSALDLAEEMLSNTPPLVSRTAHLKRTKAGDSYWLTEPAGTSTPLHRHREDEIVECRFGQVVVQVGINLISLLPGESYTIPAGKCHRIKFIERSLLVINFP